MKYTLTNTINKPFDELIEKFKDPEGIKHWMDGLQKIEHISGIPNEVGYKRTLHFLHKNKEMEIIETILEQNLPHQIKFAYQSPMGNNEVEMLFEKITDTSVKQTNNTEMELKGIMKVMGPLIKGMFKKYSLKLMTAFKTYAEHQIST